MAKTRRKRLLSRVKTKRGTMLPSTNSNISKLRQNSDRQPQISDRKKVCFQNFNFASQFSKNLGFQLQILHFWTKIIRQENFADNFPTTSNLGVLLPASPRSQRHCWQHVAGKIVNKSKRLEFGLRSTRNSRSLVVHCVRVAEPGVPHSTLSPPYVPNPRRVRGKNHASLITCLPACLSVCLSSCLSACLPFCLSLSLSVCLFVSVCLLYPVYTIKQTSSRHQTDIEQTSNIRRAKIELALPANIEPARRSSLIV